MMEISTGDAIFGANVMIFNLSCFVAGRDEYSEESVRAAIKWCEDGRESELAAGNEDVLRLLAEAAAFLRKRLLDELY